MKKAFGKVRQLIAVLLAVTVFISLPNYNAYAVVTSSGAIARGIDVSRYQGTINWSQVAASGVKFAFLRIGNTKGGLDPTFIYNYQQATANGIQVGVYLYSYATNVDQAMLEAQLTLAWLGDYGLQLPVVYDVEDKVHTNMSTEELFLMINTYCSMIDAAGYYPMVYTYKNFYHGKLGTSPWDKWMAQYGSSLNTNENVAFWQYSSSGSVPGISGRVDMDYQYKSYKDLIINEGFLNHNGGTRFYTNYKMKTGWIDYQNNKYFADALGYVQKGWYMSPDGGMYFFDTETGAEKFGVVEVAGFNFFFDPESGRQTYGFVDTTLGKRYFDPLLNGAMATSWFAYEGQIHYANEKGDLMTGFVTIDGLNYFFDENGAMVVNQMISVGTKQYQAAENGVLVEIVPIDLTTLDLNNIDPATGLYHDPVTDTWINPYTGAVVEKK